VREGVLASLLAALILVMVAAPRTGGAAQAHGAAPNPSPPLASPTQTVQSPIPSVSATPAQTNPFPSPSPSGPGPFQNGFVTAGYLWGQAGGGTIQPQAGAFATPHLFPGSAHQSGFWLNMAGRLGPSYMAALSYENSGIFGGDHPYLSYAQLQGFYEPPSSRAGFGIGFTSVQRSTASVNMNSFGAGVTLFPNFSARLSPYGSIFFYPHLQAGGTSSSLFSSLAGFVVVPRPGAGFFIRAGVSAHCCLPQNTSPKSDFGTTIGIGTAF
jgi:hypothetical protein